MPCFQVSGDLCPHCYISDMWFKGESAIQEDSQVLQFLFRTNINSEQFSLLYEVPSVLLLLTFVELYRSHLLRSRLMMIICSVSLSLNIRSLISSRSSVYAIAVTLSGHCRFSMKPYKMFHKTGPNSELCGTPASKYILDPLFCFSLRKLASNNMYF